jgi:hypothetical protein
MNEKSRYHTRPPEYHDKQRVYMRKWAKTKKARRSYREWRKTAAGRKYRLRACMNRYYRNRAWIDAYKLKIGCQLCGFNKWAEALDFDHKNPKDKLFNVSQKLQKSIKTLQNEIKKCIVLCANCHRHRSKKRGYRG